MKRISKWLVVSLILVICLQAVSGIALADGIVPITGTEPIGPEW